MPLVVPGINSSFGDKSEWVNKLMGKTIGDTSNETDLPESHRVLKPGDMKTMDHNPNRLNIHVNEEGAVHDVNYG
ncbi:Pc16g05690 [Penicillium rubens Wisconsin 54-1255]|uniref:Pc16g05690 protein n=1 Tax=Penicillium rubens (strain ATCC 28089 / DSM 1075 / NRRL 1951 / Wisconsin 54-1255) TaxID=500485 RepID=B6H8G3_PENRW|nr:Pc16g05690 [Penicillium rubens Wisconsin 54-1255]